MTAAHAMILVAPVTARLTTVAAPDPVRPETSE